MLAHWPGVVPAGKVCRDLVDTTDFLPTLCAAAGITPPAKLPLDGRSFLPQLRGEPGQPRDWTYCWYARDGGPKAQAEFARTQRYKLTRDGAFYDLAQDPKEKAPLAAAALPAAAAAARTLLQGALEQYRAARPAQLGKAGGKAAGKKGGAAGEE